MREPSTLVHGLQLETQPLDFPKLPDWWQRAEDNPDVQHYVNLGIASSYALVGLVALVQLIRIHVRVPEYGWTTQKVFHLLNFLVCGLRVGIFTFRQQVEGMHAAFLKLALLDMPGLLFFTTYTLLVLFWAEIYHQARSMPIGMLRPKYIILNVVVYAVQIKLWAVSTLSSDESKQRLGYLLSDIFLATVSVTAAIGFLLYGGRLIFMLQRFPIESRGRRRKLWEVGLVTSICAGCFSTRCVLVALSAADRQDLEIDLLNHPLLNAIYYLGVEVLPTAAVLYILRKLPPRRNPPGYQQINSGPAPSEHNYQHLPPAPSPGGRLNASGQFHGPPAVDPLTPQRSPYGVPVIGTPVADPRAPYRSPQMTTPAAGTDYNL